MTTLNIALSVPFAAALALTAGCGPGNSAAQSAGVHPALSWMAPDAKKGALLYVSDLGTSDVYVYSYPKGKLEGTLTGFEAPHGGCVDSSGDVFITDAHDSRVIEYAHGGTSPIATLEDGTFAPVGCSFNAKTGDLAVANFSPVKTSGSGNVAIYQDAQGTPSFYGDSAIATYSDCAYDRKGNLYVTGGDANGNFKFAELPSGSTTYTNIGLDQQIFVPGGVQWDGKYVAVEDQGAGYRGSTVYEFSVSGTTGTKVGTTPLDGSANVLKFWIYRHKIIGGNTGSSPSVMFWSYPAGGSALETLTGFSEPSGVTVSPAE